MKSRVDLKRWKDYIPSIFSWLETIKPVASEKPGAGDVCFVATKATKDGFEIDAPGMSADVSNSLVKLSSDFGWAGKGGVFRTTLGENYYVLVPTAAIESTGVQKARQVGIDAVTALADVNPPKISVFETADGNGLEIIAGLSQGWYSMDAAKGKREPKPLPASVNVVGAGSGIEAKWQELSAYLGGIIIARFAQDLPPNILDSVGFADFAESLSKDYGMDCKILDESEFLALGMGGFLSVAAGSDIPAKLIDIKIKGKSSSKTLALVGKGLTFDAGGISLKPSASMDEMKYDMSGGGAVLGAAFTLGKIQPPYDVHCIIGACENMPSADPTRPGDVVTMANGKSVEVLNTDAEGRLVLGDCLCYANQNYSPAMIINVATLTGSVLHALGHFGAAVMSNNDALANQLIACGTKHGEPFWQLPLWPEVAKELKGSCGDLTNIAKPNVRAGSIVGGAFLREFVGETPWAHLDIAATAWSCKATGFPASGGTGYSLRTMVGVCLSYEG